MKKTILFLLCTLCFLMAVASIACTGGGTHEHYFTQEVATVRYLASDATCTQSATYYYSCKCGIKDTDTFEYGTPLGHDFSDWQVVTQPTETEEGLKTRKCMRKGCGYTESENIEVIGHTHSFTAQIITDEFLASSATCVNKATYYYSCACGEKNENTFEYGEPLGHDFSDWQVVTQPTETEDGLKTRKCRRTGCDYSENKSIPVLSHTHKFTAQVVTDEFLATKATCTKKATYYYSCVCGENGTQTFEYGDPIGHKFNAQIVTDEFLASSATCVKKATYYYACSLCEEKGTKTYEYGNLIAHTVSDWIIDSEATCTTNGSKHKECTVCYTVFETETIPAGHNFESGVCTRCGTPKAPTEGLEYMLNYDNKSYMCTGLGSATDTDIVIASEYNGLPVTLIDSKAFSDCSSLTSITLPDSLLEIYFRAFSGCSGLTSITMRDGLLRIWDCAFSGCSSLTSVTIPDSVIVINDSAFAGCSGITSITLPDSLLVIGDNAFEDCGGLTSIILPDSLLEIGANAFMWCDGLISVTLPDSLTSIGSGAFRVCSSLTSITIPDSVTSIGSGAFAYCSGLTLVTIPGSATSIGSGAFSDCNGLEKIIVSSENTRYHDAGNCLIETASKTLIAGCKKSLIPTDGSVTSIGDYAFAGHSGLTSITIPDSVILIGYQAFAYCGGLEKIVVDSGNTKYHAAGNCLIETASKTLIVGCKKSIIPTDGSVTSIGEYAFYGCGGLTSIIIPDGITSIGVNAFSYCSDLTSIIISDSVTSIDIFAFYDCINLQYSIFDNAKYLGNQNNPYIALIKSNDLETISCKINQNTKVIAKSAFYDCRNITSITIPDSVAYINESAFENCSGLTSVVIGDNVISIGDSAFSNCSNLTSITIGNSVTSIGSSAFYDCRNITSITIPNSVTYINESAFKNCSGLTSVVIGDNVISIGDSAFSNCSNLTSITIGNSVTSIGSLAFYDCSNLKSITIPDSVTSIADSAFFHCSNLTSITIPDSVTSIGHAAFAYCRSLTSITIPDSVTSIGSSAFFNCSSLTSIIIPDSVISIGYHAFRDCSSLTSVTIGNSVTSIGDYAFFNCSSLTNVTFKNTTGWKVTNGREAQTLQSSSLSNVYTAAQYLKSDFCGYTWERG